MATQKKKVQSEVPPKRDAWNEGPWNEIASLVLFVAGFVVLMALVSYSSTDPSFNAVRSAGKTRNWVGPFGANLADFLYQTFGLAALFVPISLFLGGWWQWHENMPKLPKAKILGMSMMFIALTGMLTFIGTESPKAFYLGGFFGRWLVYGPVIGLQDFLGPIGTVFALMLLFMIGLVIGTQISIVGAVIHFTPLEQRMEQFNTMGRRFWSRRDRGYLPASGEEIPRLETVSETPAAGKRGKGGSAGKSAPAAGALPVPPGPVEGPYPKVQLPEPTTPDFVSSLPPAPPTIVTPEAPAAKVKAASPANEAPATRPLPGAARRASAPLDRADQADSYDEGDLAADDMGEAQPHPGRSVAEMMATASVKRSEAREEKEPARPAAKPAKTAISRTLTDFKLPSTEMLTPPAPRSEMEEAELMERARQLAEKCNEFNVSGQVKQISPGPVVTTFEFKPDPGVKYSRVTSLVDDLCLALKAESIRIDRLPGKSTVGIEVPNSNREVIRLREVIESKKFRESASKLTFALGKTIDGSNYAADLAKMPHLLIAGATGAGKSVMLNTILVSLLYKSTPDEVKMILVDPKRLELGLYADIPHLLTPIVTDPKRASYALKWAVSEMENRYKHLATFGVRNIDQYNKEVCGSSDRKRRDDDPEAPQPLPYIVVVIDELADLMMVSARDVEESITRLAQMARAVGIHLVLATQRPSVDVITGLIKANFPSRISFRVSSKVDSRTIIDSNGAEQLLGQGDMLFLPPGTSRLVRVHGAYVDEKEVKRISDFVRSQANPTYDEKVVMSEKEVEGGDAGDLARDEKYDEALRIVIQSGKASTSLLQRTLRIGYGRAASIIDMMHREGIVGPEDGSKPRQVLVKADFLERLDQLREE